MADPEETDSTMVAEPSEESQGAVGSRIAQSFKNRSVRLKGDEAGLTAGAETAALTSLTLSGKKAKSASGLVTVSGQPPHKNTTRVKAGSRRARLRIARVDPWSVMKITLLFAVAGWIILIVATWAVFAVLDGTGLYDAINNTVSQIFTSPGSTSPFNIKSWVNTTRATALAALVGAVNVVIVTALATIFAFLYNLAATVMGGIEVSLSED